MDRVLVIGGSSFVGSNVCRDMSKSFDVTFTYNTNAIEIPSCKSLKLDISDAAAAKDMIQNLRPKAVILLSAVLTDECELDKKRAHDINYSATSKISDICSDMNTKLVFTSTSYVFDGSKGMYSEDDQRAPVNYYGQTKVLAEDHIVQNSNNFLIARLSYPYGMRGDNVLNWFLNQAKQGKKVNAFSDQFTSPTSTMHISKAFARIIEKDATGILNIADKSRANKVDFFRSISEVFGVNPDISETNSDDANQPARRPKDSSLDVSKAERTLGSDIFTDVKTALVELKNSV
jgi:dTDP-4-dehydrorhamnose reductase